MLQLFPPDLLTINLVGNIAVCIFMGPYPLPQSTPHILNSLLNNPACILAWVFWWSSRKFQSEHCDLSCLLLFNTCTPSHISVTAGKWGNWPSATPSSCREWQTVQPDGENGNQPSANCGTVVATKEGTEEGSNAGGTHQLGPVSNSSSVVWCGGALVYETYG